jgi:hypothetical protein
MRYLATERVTLKATLPNRNMVTMTRLDLIIYQDLILLFSPAHF